MGIIIIIIIIIRYYSVREKRKLWQNE